MLDPMQPARAGGRTVDEERLTRENESRPARCAVNVPEKYATTCGDMYGLARRSTRRPMASAWRERERVGQVFGETINRDRIGALRGNVDEG